MRCVVTGSSGFIGSHLAQRLRADGHEVVGVDPASDVSCSTADESVIWQPLGRFDWFFHLGARADIVASIADPETYHDYNVTGTIHALQAAREMGAKFIYAASSSCYGLPSVFPTPEDAPLSPQYPYALTKMVGEQYALHWMQVYGLPVVSLRLFNVYGPRHRTSGAYGAVMGVFLAQKANGQPLTVVGDGEQRRDFTHVSDVVNAMVIAAESDVTGVFNVGSGQPHSVNELADLIGGPRVAIPKRPGEPDITHANITKIQKALKWAPSVPFDFGVSALAAHAEDWKEAPVWTPETIAQETAAWHRCLAQA